MGAHRWCPIPYPGDCTVDLWENAPVSWLLTVDADRPGDDYAEEAVRVFEGVA